MNLDDLQTYLGDANLFASFTTIICLLFSGRPFAVVWMISFVVIYSLYRKSLWTETHIRKKVFKLIPSITNVYTSTSVVLKSWICSTETSLFNTHPNSVSRGMTHAMFGIGTSFNDVILQATARPSYSSSQTVNRNINTIATVAFTNPSFVKIARWSGFYGDQSSESLPSEIKFSHVSIITR